MTIWRKDAKRDAVEPVIVEALRAAGVRIWRLSKPFDLLCGIGGRFVILEVKSQKRLRRDQAHQTAEIHECQQAGLPVYIVRSVDDALQAVGLKR